MHSNCDIICIKNGVTKVLRSNIPFGVGQIEVNKYKKNINYNGCIIKCVYHNNPKYIC